MITTLKGEKSKVLLDLFPAGIGDVIHALPATWQLIQDGFDVTVNCNPFVASLWAAIGAKTISKQSLQGELWIESEFGTLCSPHEWNWKTEWKDRFESFGDEIHSNVPESFDWIGILKPVKMNCAPYTLFAPESTRLSRSLPERRAREIAKAISGEVVWLTQGSRLPSLAEWRRVETIAPDNLHHITGIQSEAELLRLRTEESLRLAGKTHCSSVEEILSLVYSAEQVIAVESSIAAIASAFGKSLTIHHGITNHLNTIGQFKRFNPDWIYEAIEEPLDATVLKNSLIGEEKLYQIQELINPGIPGAVAELGVYRGGTARLLAREFKDRPCFFFDTFEGMPFSDNEDVHEAGDFSDVSLEDVQKILSDCPNASCIKGTFPHSAKGIEDKMFAFVHVDADQYRSTKEALEFFWPRMNTGGVIAFDDYLWPKCPGVARALTEFGQPIHSPIPFFAYIVKD